MKSFGDILVLLQIFERMLKINISKGGVAGILLEQQLPNGYATHAGGVTLGWSVKYLGVDLDGNPCFIFFWDLVVEKVPNQLD